MKNEQTRRRKAILRKETILQLDRAALSPEDLGRIAAGGGTWIPRQSCHCSG